MFSHRQYFLQFVLSLALSTSVAWQTTQLLRHHQRCLQLFLVAPQQLGSFESLPFSSKEIETSRKVLLEDWTTTVDSNCNIPFEEAWTVQKKYLQQHLDRQHQDDDNDSFLPNKHHIASTKNYNPSELKGVDRIIMLQHAPVYTLGTASDASLVLDNNDIPVIRMDRGGEVTYHGPGQLTVYPVLDLRNYRQDIHWWIRALEEAVLVALMECFEKHGLVDDSIRPERDDAFTGVFVPGYGKIAAIGVKCRRWITQHGVAINVTPESLPPFRGIVPCGLTGDHGQVTCVNDLVKEPVSVSQMATYMRRGLDTVLSIHLQPIQ